jgi:glycosyltransferase involved in cell wall biosynthesis
MLKVLILSTNSDEAGAPRHVEALVRSLSSQVLFSAIFGADGPILRRLRASGITTRVIHGLRSKISPFADLKSLIEIVSVIREEKPDIIHCHSSKAGLLGRIAGHITQTTVVFTVHGWSWDSLPKPKRWVALAVERALALAPLCFFIYVSEAVRRIGQSRLHLKESQGEVVLNGVPDLGRAESENDRPIVFLMPARAAYPKDHETVVRAFERVTEPAQLIFAGESTDSRIFREKLETWAPTKHAAISVLGTRNDVPDLLKRSHVMILSSRSEAMPLSILEAMSSGLAVIATDVGGIKEQVIDRVTGLLVPVGAIDQMASAMQALMSDDLRSTHGTAGRSRYEEIFSIERMAEKTFAIYRRLQSKARR